MDFELIDDLEEKAFEDLGGFDTAILELEVEIEAKVEEVPTIPEEAYSAVKQKSFAETAPVAETAPKKMWQN